MRTKLLASVFLCIACLSACSAAVGKKEHLIKTIEGAVNLPEGARPLDRYERYYAEDNGRVLGVFTVHDGGHRQEVLEFCKGLDEAPFPCPVDGKGLRLVAAGQSLWLDDPLDLPAKSGGGCSHVTLSYSTVDQKFERVECNGDY
jgi:hypothetical protein